MIVSGQCQNFGIVHIKKNKKIIYIYNFCILRKNEKSGFRAQVPISQEVARSGEPLLPLNRPSSLPGHGACHTLWSQTWVLPPSRNRPDLWRHLSLAALLYNLRPVGSLYFMVETGLAYGPHCRDEKAKFQRM